MQLGTSRDNEQNNFLLDSNSEVARRVVVTEGNINVSIDALGDVISAFNSISSVAASTVTSLVTYTVPVGKIFFLQMIDVGGSNIAKYDVFSGVTLIAIKRTYFGNPLATNIDFAQTNCRGLKFVAGEIITVKVEHLRPFIGDFEGRIIGIEAVV
jgi:hypothetical protein